MADFPPLMPDGDLQEVFSAVFFVTGTSRPRLESEVWQFSRDMIVIREGEALTLVNTVRLEEAGLAALDRLGRIKNVVKIGAFHGIDDGFYVDRYGADLWAPPGMEHESGSLRRA